MKKCGILFEDQRFSEVLLPEGASLSEELTVHNSPILFGCRIGICGTCSIEVLEGHAHLHERTENENEYLETMAPGQKDYRLSCQIHINADIKVRKVEL